MFGGTEISGARASTHSTQRGIGHRRVAPGGGLSESGRQKKNDQNEIWSMVKTRRNMSEVDWRLLHDHDARRRIEDQPLRRRT